MEPWVTDAEAEAAWAAPALAPLPVTPLPVTPPQLTFLARETGSRRPGGPRAGRPSYFRVKGTETLIDAIEMRGGTIYRTGIRNGVLVMDGIELRALIEAPLRDLAAAREYVMSHPASAIPVARDLCPDCGSSDHKWPMWISLTARCSGSWHQ